MSTSSAFDRQPLPVIRESVDVSALVSTLTDSLNAQLYKLTGAYALSPDVREAVIRDVARNLAQAVLGVIEPVEEEAA